MARRRMRKVQVGKTPPRAQPARKFTAKDIEDIVAGRTWSSVRKRRSPGRPVLVVPFLRVTGAGAKAKPRARVRQARLRRRGRGLFGALFELFGGPTRRRGGRVLPFKKTAVRRKG